MVDMVQLQFFLCVTFETMGEGVHPYLITIFQKQLSSD